MTVFGPIPSRRLGRSLGINHLPPKVCTYCCAYCQLGRRIRMQTEPEAFHDRGELLAAVAEKLAQARRSGETVDYLTFVPDGEPTLDAELGAEIEAVRRFGIPVAVITNASLLHREDVRSRLSRADWVSVKVDTVDGDTWRRLDRPHRRLDLADVLRGTQDFAAQFAGTLATETVLVNGVNDSPSAVAEVAGFVAGLRPDVAYVSVPTRPPAEKWVRAPSEAAVHRAWQTFNRRLPRVEHLLGYEGNAFAATGDAAEDILSIAAVHPMREEAVRTLLQRANSGWHVVEGLLREGKLATATYEGRRYLMRTVDNRAG